jgi:diaminopropionate ammonia-lyase
MEGYTAMADESIEQILALDKKLPTHIFLQHGVGSMAASVLSYMVERFKVEGLKPPITIIMEPFNAACAFESAKKGDGSSVDVEGDLDSMIAGLCCGVVSEIAWPLIWKHVDGAFTKVSDGLAGNGMRLLKQEGVESGECGGAAVGLLQRLMASKCAKAAELRKELDLSVESRVLIINTEGATDPANYEKQLKLQDVPYSDDDFEFVVRRIRKHSKRSFDEMSDPQMQ